MKTLTALFVALAVSFPALAIVTTSTNSATYIGTGAITSFVIPFKVLAASDLAVQVNGVPKALVTDYSVSLLANTGTVFFVVAPANGSTVLITRQRPLTQPQSFRVQGPLNLGTLENTFDALEMQIQQLNSLYSNPPATVLPVNVVAKLNGIRFADQFANIQAAITDAGTTGSVIIPPNYAGVDTYLNINKIQILDLRIGTGATGFTLKKLNGIRFADAYSVGSNTGGIAEAYTDCPSTGCRIILGSDITISSSQTIAPANGKPFILDMAGHKITLTHTSGVGLTFDGGTFRQPFTITHGTIAYSGSTAGITGLKLVNSSGGSVRDVLFTGFTSANQIVTLLDFSEDFTFDTVQWVGNSGTGTISLDLTTFASANSYKAVIFQQNYQAIRIRGGTSQNWFSDCLVQSQTGPNAVVVQVTGADANITGTTFRGCHFENNGDGSANSSAIFFNTDAGKFITTTLLHGNYFQGTPNGATGVALRFSATGSPQGTFTTSSNYFIGFASVQAGAPSGSTAVVSLNDNDTTSTMTSSVSLGRAGAVGAGGNCGDWGVGFSPQGGAKKYQLYTGFPTQFDGFLVFRDCSVPENILTYNSSIWTFPKQLRMSAAPIIHARGVLAYGATVNTDALSGNVFSLTVTNGVAFTIANPTNLTTGQKILYVIRNTSGGAMGALSWGSVFKVGAFTNPATANSRSTEFVYDGTNLIQLWQSATDVPN